MDLSTDSNGASSANIYSLPAELLREIFPLSVTPKAQRSLNYTPLQFNTTALAISHTCATWRTLSLSLPHMWSTITVFSPDKHTVHLATLYLDLSGDTVPLDLTLRESHVNGGGVEQISAIWYECSTAILSQWISKVTRWRTIDLNLDQTPLLADFKALTPENFANVEAAMIRAHSRGWTRRDIDWFWETVHQSPKLTEVRWFDFEHPPKSAPLAQLTKVSIGAMTMFRLSTFLPSCPLIRDLEIERLKGSAMDGVLTVPHLERLKIATAELDYAVVLKYLTTPRLQILEMGLPVEIQDENVTALQAFLIRSECKLRQFRLRALTSEEPSVLRMLRYAAPYLESLAAFTLHLWPITDQTIAALTPCLNEDSVDVLFPSLDDLGLICCRVDEEGSIGKMVSARIKAGVPLSVCDVQVTGKAHERDEEILRGLKESGALRELYFSRRG